MMDEFEQTASPWGVTIRAVAAFCAVVAVTAALTHDGDLQIADANGATAIVASNE